MEQLFITATRNKYRYPSTKGLLTTEDLWTLPLTSARNVCLEEVAQTLNSELESTPKKSFVTKSTPKSAKLQAQLDIVVFIINTKLAEAERAETSKVTASKKEMLTAILTKKKDAAYENMTEAEIVAELAKL